MIWYVSVPYSAEEQFARAEKLGGKTIQPAQQVPGVTFGVFADAQGHVVGVAAN